MPIIGLTDRGLALPEIGQIRKGGKKPENEKRPGKDLKYFRVEFDEQETEARDTFVRVYGESPTDINIVLPFNEIERCWDAWLEAYTAGRMVARSDGVKFTYLVDTKTGESKVKGGEPYTPYTEGMIVGTDYKNQAVRCKPVGRLKVIIPELRRAAYLVVMTTSINDIAHLSEQLEAFKTLNNGVIAGIPFVLRRRPKKISIPKNDSSGNKMRLEKWMLSIEADPAWVQRKLIEVKHLAMPGLLPGDGWDDDSDPEPTEADEWEQEFDEDEEPEVFNVVGDELLPLPITAEGIVIMDEAEGELPFDDMPVPELAEGVGEVAVAASPVLQAPFKPADIYQAVVEAGLSENTWAAMQALTRHCHTGFAYPEMAIEWMTAYREARKNGDDPEAAGEVANYKVTVAREVKRNENTSDGL